MESVIIVGIVAAVAAGFACVYAHNRAERRAWGFLWRYGAAGVIWLGALVPVFVASVTAGLTPLPVSGLLYTMAVLILAAMGLATLACYQPPIAMRDEDELEAKINRALGKK